jgi:molybdopterin-guanine dinucleotide biosynthesis protein A
VPGAGFDAVVLAGGHARRLGGVDKPGLVIGGSTLAASVVTAAVGAGAHRVIVAGPPRPELAALRPGPPGGLLRVHEEPPGAGPVPALRAALAHAVAPLVAVLAADLPFLRAGQLRMLVRAAAGGPVVAEDEQHSPQWLLGVWPTGPLREALRSYRGTSLHGLFAPLKPLGVGCPRTPGEPPPWLDCDTEADLRRAREFAGGLGPAERRATR